MKRQKSLKENIIVFLQSKGFETSTLQLLSDINLEKLAAEYNFLRGN